MSLTTPGKIADIKSKGRVGIVKLYYRGLLLLLLAIPFFTSNQWRETHYEAADQYLLLWGGVLAVSVLVHLLVVRRRGVMVTVNGAGMLLAVLFLYILLRTMAMSDQSLAGIPLLKTLVLILIYCCLRWLGGWDAGLKDWVLYVLTAVGAAEASLGILQAAGVMRNVVELFRIGGSFGNPGQYADYLVIILPAPLLAGLVSRRREKKIFFLTAALLMLAGILLSRARIAWIAMAAVLLLVAEDRFRLVTRRGKKLLRPGGERLRRGDERLGHTGVYRLGRSGVYWLGWLGVVAVMVLLAGWLYRYKPSSSHGRIFIWRISGEMIRDHPLWGVGANRFEQQYGLYQAAWFHAHPDDAGNAAVADNTTVAFNEYWQLIAEYGIVAGVLMMAGLVLVVREWWRAWVSRARVPEGEGARAPAEGERWGAGMTLGALTAFLITAMASYPLHIVPVDVSLVVMLAMGGVAGRAGGAGVVGVAGGGRVVRLRGAGVAVVAGLLLAGCVAAAVVVVSHDRYLYKWKRAEALANAFKFEEAGRAYGEAFHGLDRDPLFLSAYGSYLLSTGYPAEAVGVLRKDSSFFTNSYLHDQLGLAYQQLHAYAAAEKAFVLAGDITPVQFVPKYHLFLLYKEEGQWAKCLRVKEQIDHMPVKVPSVMIDNIRADVRSIMDSAKAGSYGGGGVGAGMRK